MSDENIIVSLNDQDFETLKSEHDEKNLFVDETFPFIDVGYFEWKRPKEVIENPKIMLEPCNCA